MYNKGHCKQKFIRTGQGFRSSRAHIKRHWKGRVLQKGSPKNAMAVTTARADLKTSLTSGRGKLSTGSRTHKGNRRKQGKRGQVEQKNTGELREQEEQREGKTGEERKRRNRERKGTEETGGKTEKR